MVEEAVEEVLDLVKKAAEEFRASGGVDEFDFLMEGKALCLYCGLLICDIDIFVNCNWVNTRWQWYSTHNQYKGQHK